MVGRHHALLSRWHKPRLILAACGVAFCVSWLGAHAALATIPATHDGKDGINGTNGKDGTNGLDGKRGPRGLRGPQGHDGADIHDTVFRFTFGTYRCTRAGGTNVAPVYDCSSVTTSPKGP